MKQDETQTLARLLRQARIGAGLTAREVARRAGLNVTDVTRIESGQRTRPTPETIRAIGKVLGISAADLFAAADWLPKDELPTLQPYLRAKYRDLPDEAVAEVERLINNYTERYGSGPRGGEDEQEQ